MLKPFCLVKIGSDTPFFAIKSEVVLHFFTQIFCLIFLLLVTLQNAKLNVYVK